ncbi:MAG: hypothetical protein H7Z19_00055 [Chitinophagaceae bacterium]|nr:hypothetical protein [Rubrivivax sp.]
MRLQAYGQTEVPDLGSDPAPAAAVGPVGQVGQVGHLQQPVQVATGPAGPADFIDLSDAVDPANPGDQDGLDDHPVEHRQGAGNDSVVTLETVETMDRATEIAAMLALSVGNAPELPVHQVSSVVQELPVLTEVIDAAEFQGMNAAANEPPPGTLSSPTSAEIHELAPARKTATRSRLMRMKDKGLFKNE